MAEHVRLIAEWSAMVLELIGVFLIVLLALFTLVHGTVRLFKEDGKKYLFREIRQRLGRGILLGLEFLVAADIIHTVVVELTFQTVGVLGVIVVIRTFLSFTLEVELTGRWPWQKRVKNLDSDR